VGRICYKDDLDIGKGGWDGRIYFKLKKVRE